MSEVSANKLKPATKINDRIVRVDALQKARGEAMYVCDMTLPDMQYAYMVRSTVPRGRIKAIHFRRATILSLPGTFPQTERTSCG